MRRWIGKRIGALALLAAPAAVGCEGDMGGAEEHARDPLRGEPRSPAGQQDVAGGGQGGEVEGTDAPNERLGP